MNVAIIVAIAEGNAIGKDQQLLCHMPADLKRFKALTTGHTIIMGRKTFESLPHALPNRRNIVLSSQPNANFPGCEVCASLPEALALCAGEEEVFIIGGGQVYRQALALSDTLYITRIHHAFPDATTFFPELDAAQWEETEREEHPADEKNPYPYTYANYRRKRNS